MILRLRVDRLDLLIVATGLSLVAGLLALATAWPGADPGTGAGPAAAAAHDTRLSAISHLRKCAQCRAAGLTADDLMRGTRSLPCLTSNPEPSDR